MSWDGNKSEEQQVAEADVESHRKDLLPFVVAAEKNDCAAAMETDLADAVACGGSRRSFELPTGQPTAVTAAMTSGIPTDPH